MAKKDDEIAGSYVPPPAHMPQRNVSGDMRAQGTITITGSATMSATEAIVSVTSKDMRAELDAFWEQFNQLPQIEQKALAKGTATAENLGINTKLPQETTKGMAHLRSLDDELKERRAHDKELANINASGPVRAEIWNRVLTGAGVVLGLVLAYLLGKYGLLT